MPRQKVAGPFTEIIPAFLVKGVCLVELEDGRRRRVQVSNIIPAPSSEAACVAALMHVAQDLGGARPRWQEVSARWIASQYMWAFDEASARKEAPAAAPDTV